MPDDKMPSPPKIDFAEIIARRRAKAVQEAKRPRPALRRVRVTRGKREVFQDVRVWINEAGEEVEAPTD